VVKESGSKQALNTPGGNELLAKLGGSSSLPFLAFVDTKGELIVNSIRPGEGGKPGVDIGHPVKPHEIDWFLTMLRRSAPAIVPDEIATVEKWLRSQKK
jgi:hypothetical protein